MRLAERPRDWYTQDAHGTVSYYAERAAGVDRRVVARRASHR